MNLKKRFSRSASLLLCLVMVLTFIPSFPARATATTEDNPIIFAVRGLINSLGEVEYRIVVDEIYTGMNYQSFTVTYPKELEVHFDKIYDGYTNDLTQYWTVFQNTDGDPKSLNAIIKASTRTPNGLFQDLGSIQFTLADPEAEEPFPPDGSTVTVTATKDKVAFFQDDDGYVHYYKFEPNSGITWTNAYNAAKLETLQDPRYPDDPSKRLQGYLATITSKEEQDTVFDTIADQCGWLGGTRIRYPATLINDESSITGVSLALARDGSAGYLTNPPTSSPYWYWACGPEAGQIFTMAAVNDSVYTDPYGLTGGTVGKPPNPIDQPQGTAPAPYTGYSYFAYWSPGEPNNYNYVSSPGEYCLLFAWITGNDPKGDHWNDYEQGNTSSLMGYYVEFGGYPGDPKSDELTGGSVTTTSEVELVMPILVQYRSTIQNETTKSYNPITQIGTLQDRIMTYESSIPFTVVRNYGTFDGNLTGYTPYGYAFYGQPEDGANLTLKANGDVDGFYSTYTQRILFLFKPDAYTLTFDANFPGAGSADVSPGSKTINFDSLYGELATARRPGYTFVGWNTVASGGGTTIIPESLVAETGDHTLYAQWTEKSGYTVNYDLNGGDASSAFDPKTGVTWTGFGLLPVMTPTRVGYIFTGWDVSLNGSKQDVKATDTYGSLAANDMETSITLQAQWMEEQLFLVIYHLNGAESPLSIPDMEVSAYDLVLLPEASRAGYTFAGWKVTNDGAGGDGGPYFDSDGKTYGEIAAASSHFIIVEAQWTPKTYTVNYDKNDDSGTYGSSKSGVLWSQNGLVPPDIVGNPTREHWIFMGWNTDPDGDGSTVYVGSTYSQLVANDSVTSVTLYAQWMEEKSYFVSYDTNGGLPSSIPDNTGVYSGSDNLLPANPTPPVGYDFQGWSVVYNGSKAGVTIADTFGDLAADPNLGYIVLKAQYSPKGGLTVFYDVNGHTQPPGSPGPPALPDYPIKKPANPDPPDNDPYVVWTQSNLLPSTDPVATDSSVFVGWNTAQNGSGIPATNAHTFGDLSADGGASGELTLYAQWALAAVYTVRYNVNGGPVSIPNETLTATTNIVPAPTPTAPAGYNFIGWTVEDNGYGQGTSSSPDGDTVTFAALAYPGSSYIVLRANYAMKSTYTVYYDFNYPGAPANDSLSGIVSWTQSGFVPYTAYRPGYNLLGWKAEINGADGYVLSSTQYRALANGNDTTGSVTLYAQWEEASFVVRYDLNGTTAPTGVTEFDQRTVGFDDTGLVPGYDLKRVGYTLSGWNVSENGSKLNVTATDSFRTLANSGAAYITLQAQWVPKEYVVFYDTNGGDPSTIPSFTVSWWSADLLPVDPTYTGYTFHGWKLVKIESDTVVSGTTVTALTRYSELANVGGYDSGNITLQAQWSQKTYTVHYDLNGAASPNSIASKTGVVWDDENLLPAWPNPALPGYKFTGWKVSEQGGVGVTLGSFVTASDEYADLAGDDEITNITLQAQWVSSDGYSVLYDLGGGTMDGGILTSIPSLDQCVDGTDTDLLPVLPTGVTLTKPGYTHTGWELVSLDTTPVSPVPVSATDSYISLAGSTTVMSITLQAVYTEKTAVSITYTALTKGEAVGTTGGTVSISSEYLPPVTGLALGSIATPETGYELVGWFFDGDDYENDSPITTNLSFTPDRVGGLNVAGDYVAYFKLSSYEFEVILYKDDALWNDGSEPVITLKRYDAGAEISDFDNLIFGNYTIYADHVSTGLSVNIISTGMSETLYYYTVEFDAQNLGSASGSTISATYNSVLISSGDVLLSGGELVITAVGAGANSNGRYTYLWSGAGTSGETTNEITLDPLGETVNALCKVTGINRFAVTLEVVDEEGKPLEGVEVFIRQLGNDIDDGITEPDGTFDTHDPLDSGYYNVELIYTDNSDPLNLITTTVTEFLDVNHDGVFTVVIPLMYKGRLSSQFEQTAAIPVVVAVGNLHDVYNTSYVADPEKGITSDDMDTYNDGGSVSIHLKASDVKSPEQDPESDEVKATISSDGKEFAFEIDLSAYKKAYDVSGVSMYFPDELKLSELNSLVTIYIDIPEMYQGKAGYAVYRYHDGKPERIPQLPAKNSAGECFEVDDDGTVITLTVKKFSVYAVAIADHVTLRLDANGGSVDPSSKTLAIGDSWVLPTPTRNGYTFRGWAENINGPVSYIPGVSISVNDDLTLYAQWERVSDGDGNGSGNPAGPAAPTNSNADNGDGGDGADSNSNESSVSHLLNTDEHNAYVQGRGNDIFAPDAYMTRAEAAQMFYNLLRNKNVDITVKFPDVPENKWYTTAVNSLASLGIFTGFPDGGFHPEDNISRAQFAAIAVRFAMVSPGSVRFADVPETHWAYDYINTAGNFGWVQGVGSGRFEPDRSITRAEVVTLVNKMLERYPDRAYIDSHSELIHYSDTLKTHWGYYDIMEASNTHDYERRENSEQWVR